MASEEPMWSVGLRNCDKGYLTAETFAFKLNCKSTSLKKKQTFFLEANPDGTINIKTSLGRYISAEKSGALTAEATERGPDTCLTVEAQPDGRWALKSIHGRYVGGRDEKLDAFGKTVEEDRLWVIHLAMHPQVCIKNISRKRYAHLDKDEVNCDEDVPWGADAMITMRFVDDGNSGKYELETCDGRFITEDGTLSKDNGPATRFTLQFFGGQVAFAGKSGKVLSAGGGKGALRAKAGAPGRDEMFVIEDSQPQFKFKSFQGKFVTCNAGDQAAANQPAVTDTELFQMEIDKKTKKWSFRTAKVTFLSVAADGKIVFSKDRGANEWFDVEWLGPKVAFKASNGKYVAVKPNGSLLATAANSAEEGATYIYELVNRPTLVLRGENGFIFVNEKGQVRSNSVVPEVFKLQVTAGDCKISGKTGSWAQEADGISGKAGSPEVFHFEFVEHSKLLIKTSGGKYLQGFQNGDFKPTGIKADASTLFEY